VTQGIYNRIIDGNRRGFLSLPAEPVPGVRLIKPEEIGRLEASVKKISQTVLIQRGRMLQGRLEELFPIGRNLSEEKGIFWVEINQGLNEIGKKGQIPGEQSIALGKDKG
jgi:hypothetical protein